MRKRIILIMTLFTMISVLILNCGQPQGYIVESDGVIEWHSYNYEKLV